MNGGKDESVKYYYIKKKLNLSSDIPHRESNGGGYAPKKRDDLSTVPLL